MAVSSVTGAILFIVALATLVTCRQQCIERRRRKLAVKQQQMSLDVATPSGDATNLTFHQLPTVITSSTSAGTPLTAVTPTLYDRLISATDACPVHATSGGWPPQSSGGLQLAALADCAVDAVTRRAARFPSGFIPITAERWRSSGRPPRMSTPRNLRRATTETALWTMSTASVNVGDDHDDNGIKMHLNLHHRRHQQQLLRSVRSADSAAAAASKKLSTSVPLLGGMTCLMTSPTGSAQICRAENRRRSPTASLSDERLHPITVEGVTTFPVCPSAAMLARRRNQTDTNFQRPSSQWRQRNFQITRSFTMDDADEEEIVMDEMGKFLTVVSNDNIYDGEINSYCDARYDSGSNDTTVRSMTSFRVDNKFRDCNSANAERRGDAGSFTTTRYFIDRRFPNENNTLSTEQTLSKGQWKPIPLEAPNR